MCSSFDPSLVRPRGLTILLTGLPAAGKSTIAAAVGDVLTRAGCAVTLLDGDELRRMFSRDLGFSRVDRAIQLERMAFVAGEIARHGGTTICAAVAPYSRDRLKFRTSVSATGRYVLVYVSTPLAVCEARDPRGLYSRARAGDLPDMTGIGSPYEPPDDADVVLDTSSEVFRDASAACVGQILTAAGVAFPHSPSNRYSS